MIAIKKYLLFLIGVLVVCSCHTHKNEAFPDDQKIDFDWQFHIGDVENGQQEDLNTDDWRTLDLPHDWSIEGHYSQNNGTDWQSGFLPAGIGWYRKNLAWNPEWEDKLVKILFDGIYLNSDVWINGHHLGHRPNGYVGIEYNLTPYLKKGNNVVAVRVDQSKPLTGRWYTGSGIYRHVWLKVKSPVHIITNGVYFTVPELDHEKAAFDTRITIENNTTKTTDANVNISLKDQVGREVFSKALPVSIPVHQQKEVVISGILANPNRWSPESPYLYHLTAQIEQNGSVLDRQTLKVGFRSLEFSPDFGFKLNGKVTKIKGVCDHQSAGALGVASPDDEILYRLTLLKKMGCNAIRTAHNPFSPTFYHYCDSLGLMVMDEFLDGWDTPKARDDYGNYFNEWWETDATDFIERDRNHPSVIIWSIGNEVRKPTRKAQKQLIDLFHMLDPTRPVTQGGTDPTRGMEGEKHPTLLDIKGFNGDGEEIGVLEHFHKQFPDVPVICTEVPHTYQTRGVYRTQTQWRRRDFPAQWEVKFGGDMGNLESKVFPIPDLAKEEVFPQEVSTRYYQNGQYHPIENDAPWSKNLYYQSSYDNASVRISARKAWQRTRDLNFVMGQFRWGSFDYLGESNDWPGRFANFGVIDDCGFPKDHFYLYQSMWTEEPMVHILPHWTHPGKDNVKIPVVVYTNGDEVELFLNDQSLGKQQYHDQQLVWVVPYTPGTIKAIAVKEGKVVAEDIQTTAGEPANIRLIPDKNEILANRTDVVHISAEITDGKDVCCPYAENVVEFTITGPAKIIGVDNGDPLDLSDYKTNIRKAFRGKVMLFIQSSGEKGIISIKAGSENLVSSEIHILTR